MDLTEFLLARIAEDEAVAKAATPDTASFQPVAGAPSGRVDQHIEQWHPRRVLAECEAKRRIVTDYIEHQEAYTARPAEEYPMRLLYGHLKALALPYADHPDYREEWRVAPVS